MPALELDNGQCIGETVAIWEYLEEKHPTPALIGTTAEERAEARMWQRRIELKITEHLYNGFRYSEGAALFKDRMRILPEAAPGLKQVSQDGLKWLDGLLAGREYIAGKRFTIADIILYCALDFGSGVGQKIDPSLANLNAWFKRVEARPSAKSSLASRLSANRHEGITRSRLGLVMPPTIEEISVQLTRLVRAKTGDSGCRCARDLAAAGPRRIRLQLHP